MRAISESDLIQMIIKNFQKLDISERSSMNLSSQNSIIIIQSFSAFNTVACRLSIKATVSVNLVSELIYFDLVRNELSASMNDKMIFLMKDILMLYSWLIMLTVQSHNRKSSEDDVRLSVRQVKIWVNFNRNLLDFCSAMKQDYID